MSDQPKKFNPLALAIGGVAIVGGLTVIALDRANTINQDDGPPVVPKPVNEQPEQRPVVDSQAASDSFAQYMSMNFGGGAGIDPTPWYSNILRMQAGPDRIRIWTNLYPDVEGKQFANPIQAAARQWRDPVHAPKGAAWITIHGQSDVVIFGEANPLHR